MADLASVDKLLGPEQPMLRNSPMPSRAEVVQPQSVDELLGPEQPNIIRKTDQQIQQGIYRFIDGFGYGGKRPFTEEPLPTLDTALSPQTADDLRKLGVFNDYLKGQHDFQRTIFEGIFTRAAVALEFGQRAIQSGLDAPAEAFGQMLGYKPGEGAQFAESAASDPFVQLLTTGMFPEMSAYSDAAKAENAQIDRLILQARADGVTGEGEAGFYDARPVPPEIAQARVQAAKEAGIDPPIPRPAPKDVHELARRIDPETFQKLDTLSAMRENIQQGLAQLGDAHAESVTLPTISQEELRLHSRVAQLHEDIAGLNQQITEAEKPTAESFKAQETLSRLQAVEDQLKNPDLTPEVRKDLRTRRDELLTDTTPETLRKQAAPIENLRTLRNQGASLVQERNAVLEKIGGINANKVIPKEPRIPLELQRARQRLADVDGGLRNLTPDIAEAYRQAHEMMPEETSEAAVNTIVAASEGKPVETPAPSEAPAQTQAAKGKPVETPIAPQEAAPGETPAPQAATPTGQRVGPLRPVEGTGELKARGLAEGVEEKAIEEGLTKTFGDLPEYRVVSMAEQAQKAVEFMNEDYEGAKAVAMGQKAPPKGLLLTTVFNAVEKRAIAEGDIDTLRALGTESKVTGQVTTMAQNIRALGERDATSPVAAIQDVQRARQAALDKRTPTAVQDTVKEIKAEVKRGSQVNKPDVWNSFINSITCPE